MSTPITVIADRYVRSWPSRQADKPLRSCDRAHCMELDEAIERDFQTDAHFVAYATPNGRRLNSEAINQGITIELTTSAFDIDCPLVHGTSEPAPEAWRREQREKVLKLAKVHPDPYMYETRGGLRIVYRLAEPTILQSQQDAKQWSQGYAVGVAHLERCFGLLADPACNDWQRLYRLPRATRSPGAGPENWPTWGDPHQIGVLVIEASPADVATAKRAAARSFHQPREVTFTTDYHGDGLLFWLLKNRGDVTGDAPRGGWRCLCPNRDQHSTNSDGSDATVVYAPRLGAELGILNCLHAHCAERTNRDWLKFFSQSEIDRARRAAGIERAA